MLFRSDALRFELVGAPGSRVCVRGWAARAPASVRVHRSDGAREADAWERRDDGAWSLTATLPEVGRARVAIRWR